MPKQGKSIECEVFFFLLYRRGKNTKYDMRTPVICTRNRARGENWREATKRKNNSKENKIWKYIQWRPNVTFTRQRVPATTSFGQSSHFVLILFFGFLTLSLWLVFFYFLNSLYTCVSAAATFVWLSRRDGPIWEATISAGRLLCLSSQELPRMLFIDLELNLRIH